MRKLKKDKTYYEDLAKKFFPGKSKELPPVDDLLLALMMAKGGRFKLSPRLLARLKKREELKKAGKKDICIVCDAPKDICEACDTLDCLTCDEPVRDTICNTCDIPDCIACDENEDICNTCDMPDCFPGIAPDID